MTSAVNLFSPVKASPIFRDNVHRWAVRLPVLAALAILICTLFPFQFLLQDTASRRTVSFLLWLEPYPDGFLDFAENIILFAPFGFGWACWVSKQRWKPRWAWTTALAAGVGLSYLVEFLQVFLPTRGPSWWDVLANTIGALVGYSMFEHVGAWVLAYASRLESRAEKLATTRPMIVAFATYAALTLAVSAMVQRSTYLSNWQPTHALLLGPTMHGQHWDGGKIYRLEVTDQVFSPGLAGEPAPNKQVCASQDALASSPDTTANNLCLSGKEWQQAPLPITALVKSIQKTHTFTLRILYAPINVAAPVAGRICSITDGSRGINLDLTQDQRDLTFTFRTAVLGVSRYWQLNFPSVFRNTQPTDIILTDDGAELVGYIDGKRNAHFLRLNPGAALVYRFKGINPYNVRGYEILYMITVFAPLGVFLGYGVRKLACQKPSTWILIGAAVLVPPVLQEGVLSSVSGCPFRLDNTILACGLIVGAFLLCFRSPNSVEKARLEVQSRPNAYSRHCGDHQP